MIWAEGKTEACCVGVFVMVAMALAASVTGCLVSYQEANGGLDQDLSGRLHRATAADFFSCPGGSFRSPKRAPVPTPVSSFHIGEIQVNAVGCNPQ